MKYLYQFFDMMWRMTYLYGMLVLHVITSIAVVFSVLGLSIMAHNWWLSL